MLVSLTRNTGFDRFLFPAYCWDHFVFVLSRVPSPIFETLFLFAARCFRAALYRWAALQHHTPLLHHPLPQPLCGCTAATNTSCLCSRCAVKCLITTDNTVVAHIVVIAKQRCDCIKIYWMVQANAHYRPLLLRLFGNDVDKYALFEFTIAIRIVIIKINISTSARWLMAAILRPSPGVCLFVLHGFRLRNCFFPMSLRQHRWPAQRIRCLNFPFCCSRYSPCIAVSEISLVFIRLRVLSSPSGICSH